MLQVGNVGRIVGGTGACAWSVTRALPDWEHRVLFFSPPDQETVEAFRPIPVSWQSSLTPWEVERLRADVVLLHNTSARRIVGELPVPAVVYLHSAITQPAYADKTVCCSHWLSRRVGQDADNVLWQGVGEMVAVRETSRRPYHELIVGRLCTPIARKWPPSVVAFYAKLARRFPEIRWEFVGCPEPLQRDLQSACGHRAAFHPAGWRQRDLLAEWDVMLYSNPMLEESFGRTAAEAMLAGCIPVVDRLGGFVEQIPAEAGFLCGNLDEFASALWQLCDAGTRAEVSQRARQHALTWFSLPRFGADLVSWLSKCRETRVQSREPEEV